MRIRLPYAYASPERRKGRATTFRDNTVWLRSTVDVEVADVSRHELPHALGVRYRPPRTFDTREVRYRVWDGGLVRPVLDARGIPVMVEDLAMDPEHRPGPEGFVDVGEYAPYVDDGSRYGDDHPGRSRFATETEAKRDIDRRDARLATLRPFLEGLLVVDGMIWQSVQEPYLQFRFLRNILSVGVSVAARDTVHGCFRFKVDEPTCSIFLNDLASRGYRIYGDVSHSVEVVRHDLLKADRERVFADAFMRDFCREFAEYVPHLSENVSHVARHLDPSAWNGTPPHDDGLSKGAAIRLIRTLPAICAGVRADRIPSKASTRRLRHPVELASVAQLAVRALQDTPSVVRRHLRDMPFGSDPMRSSY